MGRTGFSFRRVLPCCFMTINKNNYNNNGMRDEMYISVYNKNICSDKQ
jgi:hypothetical protein